MRGTALLLSAMALVLTIGAVAQSAASSSVESRCTRLKKALAPKTQQKLLLAEQGFAAEISGKKSVTGDEVRSLAQSAARARFPKATSAQVDVLAAIILSDWTTKQQSEIARVKKSATQARPKSSDLNTDGELASVRLNDLITKKQIVEEQMQKLLSEKDETSQDVLENLKP